jgi:dolichol kinase
MFNFNWLTSKTWWGTVAAAIGVILSPAVLGTLPVKTASIISTIGGVLAVLGLRDAIAKGPTK